MDDLDRLQACVQERIGGRSVEVAHRYRLLFGYHLGWMRHLVRARQLPESLRRCPRRRAENRDIIDTDAARDLLERPESQFAGHAPRVHLFPEGQDENGFYWDKLGGLIRAYSAALAFAIEGLAALGRMAGRKGCPVPAQLLTALPIHRDLAEVRAALASVLARAGAVLTFGDRDDLTPFQGDLLLHWGFAEVYDWHSQDGAQAYLYSQAGLIVPTSLVGTDQLRFREVLEECFDRLGLDSRD